MLQTKDGQEIKCGICGEDVDDHLFWSVMRYEKVVPTFPCEKCGKPISVEYEVSKDCFELVKNCRCKQKVHLSEELLDSLRKGPKWDRKTYVFCEKCFQKNFASPVLYAELKEDMKDA